MINQHAVNGGKKETQRHTFTHHFLPINCQSNLPPPPDLSRPYQGSQAAHFPAPTMSAYVLASWHQPINPWASVFFMHWLPIRNTQPSLSLLPSDRSFGQMLSEAETIPDGGGGDGGGGGTYSCPSVLFHKEASVHSWCSLTLSIVVWGDRRRGFICLPCSVNKDLRMLCHPKLCKKPP